MHTGKLELHTRIIRFITDINISTGFFYAFYELDFRLKLIHIIYMKCFYQHDHTTAYNFINVVLVHSRLRRHYHRKPLWEFTAKISVITFFVNIKTDCIANYILMYISFILNLMNIFLEYSGQTLVYHGALKDIK